MSTFWVVISVVFSGVALPVLAWLGKKLTGKTKQHALPAAGYGTNIVPYDLNLPGTPRPDRVYVDHSLEQIRSVFAGRTTVQVEALAREMYVGKWICVELPVFDVVEGDDYVAVSLMRAKEYTNVFAAFDRRWRPHLTHLQKGVSVKLVGRIEEISSVTIKLEDSELVAADTQGSPASTG